MVYGKSPCYKCVCFQKFIYKVFVSNLFPIDNIVHKYCFLGASYENVELKYSIYGVGFNNCIKQYTCNNSTKTKHISMRMNTQVSFYSELPSLL